MTENNVYTLYRTIADILERREHVKIDIRVTKIDEKDKIKISGEANTVIANR